MNQELTARSSIVIEAPAEEVWEALVDPEAIRQYMMGATVTSSWQEGGSIVWKGNWQGKAYEDHGLILEIVPNEVLRYTHFTPGAGKPDLPENYHTIAVHLEREGRNTRVTLTQDNNESHEAREHSERNWSAILEGLKDYVER